MDAPMFLYSGSRENSKEFTTITKNDIIATIKFLYKRGMWSKYHYTMWLKEVQAMEDEEMLHLWWDAIVGGAMFETEPMIEAKMEAMQELEEDKVEQHKVKCRRKKLMKKESKS